MKLAVIGDVHGFWDTADTLFFNQSNYHGLLFTGDLPRLTNSLEVARQLAQLSKPAWLIPGNHDAVSLQQLLAEIKDQSLLSSLFSIGMRRRVDKLTAALAPVEVVGYSLHSLAEGLALLGARPHAMGGDRFYYRRYMHQHFAVESFDDSAEKLKRLVDQAPERLVVLAHNGPAGLGDSADAPFGNDFNATLPGDFGDPDLRQAIDYARATGRQVLAVIAGHMHHRNPKTRAVRRTWAQQDNTLYLNVARVPRMRRDGSHRHHLLLDIAADKLCAETVYVSADGEVESREAIG